MPSFIEDGMTYRGYVAPVDGMHDGLDFEYLPMLEVELKDWRKRMDAVANQTNDKAEQLLGQMLAKRIRSWDLRDSKGQVVPITGQTALRLHHTLMTHVTQIVQGTKASDPRPQMEDVDEPEQVERFVEEDFAKNS